MTKLPSKKVLSVLILSAAVVASIIVAFGKDKTTSAVTSVNNLVGGGKISIPENPNWQNEFNTLGSVSLFEQTGGGSATGTETVTDAVSKSLISNYLALKQNGSLDGASAQKLIDQTINYIGQPAAVEIKASDLKIIPDNGKQTISGYGEDLGNIIKKNRPLDVKNELEIISKSIETRDSSMVAELDNVIYVYEKISTELAGMTVPNTFVKAHLDMVNGSRNMASALTELKAVFNDPIKSLAHIQLYQKGMTAFTQAMRATVIFINQNGVIYKQDSGGYYLLYGI